MICYYLSVIDCTKLIYTTFVYMIDNMLSETTMYLHRQSLKCHRIYKLIFMTFQGGFLCLLYYCNFCHNIFYFSLCTLSIRVFFQSHYRQRKNMSVLSEWLKEIRKQEISLLNTICVWSRTL